MTVKETNGNGKVSWKDIGLVLLTVIIALTGYVATTALAEIKQAASKVDLQKEIEERKKLDEKMGEKIDRLIAALALHDPKTQEVLYDVKKK